MHDFEAIWEDLQELQCTEIYIELRYSTDRQK
jgi:hypothetical protein